MKEIKPPSSLTYRSNKSIFLGGGITNCPDWQRDMVKMLSVADLILLNPRRDDFDTSDLSMSENQIKWEFDHLRIADSILLWFTCETLCPITLYELGYWAGQDKKIFVGCHPDYARKFDVEMQLSLLGGRKRVKIADSLEELSDQVKKYYD